MLGPQLPTSVCLAFGVACHMPPAGGEPIKYPSPYFHALIGHRGQLISGEDPMSSIAVVK
jgi:hypothetical protein